MEFYAGKYVAVPAQNYKVFNPESINRSFTLNDPQVPVLLERANLHLGELNAYANLVPDIDYFIQMHVKQEATTSNQIEGAFTTLAEAAMDKEEVEPEKREDWEEVQNYIRALYSSIEELNNGIPLSARIIKTAHKILLDGVRGHNKRPGQFRDNQNRIGGSSFSDAAFIPPVPQAVPDLIADLEAYWHNSELTVPKLIKIAVTHYQFETIHPFEDGNGRTGRLLITLQLIDTGYLDKPALYLSDFFVRNRREYYDMLLQVSVKHDIEAWIKFFLNGVAETAQKGKSTLQSIIALRKNYENRIEGGVGLKRQKVAKKLLLELFSKPVVTIKDIEEMINVTTPTANSIAAEFEELGLFEEKTGYSRNRIFHLNEYINLFSA